MPRRKVERILELIINRESATVFAERRSELAGHGHVTPNADGSKVRCGGPAICTKCAFEFAQAAQGENARLEAELLNRRLWAEVLHNALIGEPIVGEVTEPVLAGILSLKAKLAEVTRRSGIWQNTAHERQRERDAAIADAAELASKIRLYEWSGVDQWCVEECGGCIHHGHNEGCELERVLDNLSPAVKAKMAETEEKPESRSVQRRKAAQRGEPAPTFETEEK